jgi:hypothetical protein
VRTQGTTTRFGITIALAAMVASVAVVGTGIAASTAKPTGAGGQATSTDDPSPGKVELCHKQKVTIRVSTSARPAHEAHGDTAGACAAATGGKAKPGKASKAEKDAAKAARKAAKQQAKAARKAGKTDDAT